MSINRVDSGYSQFLHNGVAVANGTIEFTVNNDPNTQVTVYSDASLTTPESNPYTLDAYGQIPTGIFFNGSFGYILRDSDGNILRTVNDLAATTGVSAATASAAGIVELATGAETVTGTDSTRAVTPAGLTSRFDEPGTIGGTTPGAVNASTLSTTGTFTSGGDILPNNDSEDDLGSTGTRWAEVYTDALTLTSDLTIDDTTNTGVADAYGLITGTASIVGQGVVSVSTGATGVHTVTFSNAADTTDEQAAFAQSEGSSPVHNTVTNVSTTTVTVRAWLDAGSSNSAYNSFPISLVRYLFT